MMCFWWLDTMCCKICMLDRNVVIHSMEDIYVAIYILGMHIYSKG